MTASFSCSGVSSAALAMAHKPPANRMSPQLLNQSLFPHSGERVLRLEPRQAEPLLKLSPGERLEWESHSHHLHCRGHFGPHILRGYWLRFLLDQSVTVFTAGKSYSCFITRHGCCPSFFRSPSTSIKIPPRSGWNLCTPPFRLYSSANFQHGAV